MPAKLVGVYGDSRNGWYFKVTLGRDPLTGRRMQVTRRGYRTATEAARARRDLIARVDVGAVRPSSTVLTVNELLDLYLDGLDADERLSAKTRFDYRHYAQDYGRRRGVLGPVLKHQPHGSLLQLRFDPLGMTSSSMTHKETARKPHRFTLTPTINPATGDWTTTSVTLGTLLTLYARATQTDLTGNIGTSPVAGPIAIP